MLKHIILSAIIFGCVQSSTEEQSLRKQMANNGYINAMFFLYLNREITSENCTWSVPSDKPSFNSLFQAHLSTMQKI